MTATTAAARRTVAAPPRHSERSRLLLASLALAVATYLPLLLTKTGRVIADTRQMLFVDPSRFLERAPYLWDPNIGTGTVTHQNVGLLFPMGPFFWVSDKIGLPTWVAQRLWLATILFAAGVGVLFCARTLGLRAWPATAAAFTYALSPYVISYATHLSVILLPFAGLPWMLAFTVRALRRGGWRDPALFAVVVALVGSVNATALLYVGLAPVLWLVFAVFVNREATWRAGVATALRIGALTAFVSAWWAVALIVQGRYGLPVLDFTETFDTVALGSSAPEVLRGLGYWFLYGRDRLEPFLQAGTIIVENPAVVALTFVLPGLAILAATVTRWRHRAFFVALVVIGAVVAVGAHPFDDPSPLGAVFEDAAGGSTAGLALRSTTRIVPIMVLGFAFLLAAAISGLGRVRPRWAHGAVLLVAVLAFTALAPLWRGELLSASRDRPEEIPEYWQDAVSYLDEQGSDTRVLEIPGIDFGSYRWGDTIDIVSPGLMDRPVVARELVPYGTPASFDLLVALDRGLQEGGADIDALGPVAGLMSAGDVLLRSDLQYERYRVPRPRLLWDELNPPPTGLEDPVEFGTPEPTVPDPRLPLLDEVELGAPAPTPDPPPLAAFPVEDARPILRTEPAQGVLLVAGDGEGLVDAAQAGLLPADRAILYSATLAKRPDVVARTLDDGGELLVTDTNRRRGRRWRTVRENSGYTEEAGEQPLEDDPSDARLDVFPDAGDDARTVTVERGVSARASAYGNPVTLTPDDRPAYAVDGDLATAWRVGAFSPVIGERLELDVDAPVTTDRLTLVQAPDQNRHITAVRLRFDGGDAGTADVNLDESSYEAPGQVITFPEREFTTVEIEITATDDGSPASYLGLSSVGFAEVMVPGVVGDELVRLPVDLLDAAGDHALDHPLTFLVTRLRFDPAEVVRDDEEPAMIRLFELPDGRSFAVGGTARLSPRAPESTTAAVFGIDEPGAAGVTAVSSDVLSGDLASQARFAVDGDPTTHWSPGFGDQVGRWIELTAPEPVTVDHLDLDVVADGRHSVPTELTIETDTGSRRVPLPTIEDQAEPNGTVSVPVDFEPVTGERIRVTVSAVRPRETTDFFTSEPLTTPVAIAELGIDDLTAVPLPDTVPDDCRDDLVTLDGEPLPVRIVGTTTDAYSDRPLAVEVCGGAADGVALDAGQHELRAVPGRTSGIDIDQLALSSAAGGGAAVPSESATPRGPAPEVEVVDEGRASATVRVSNAEGPFWLVLGQSFSEGWQATSDELGDLDEPTLVDGYANGWYVEPDGTGTFEVTLTWTPQRWVWAGLGTSALGLLTCLAIIVVAGFRKRSRWSPTSQPTPPSDGDPPDEPRLSSPLAGTGPGLGRVAAVVLALVAGVVAAVVTTPALGVVVAVLTGLAAARPRARVLLLLAALAAYAVAAVAVVGLQAVRGYTLDFDWPAQFDDVHWVALLAVVLLGADVLVERVRGSIARRSSRPRDPAAPRPETESTAP